MFCIYLRRNSNLCYLLRQPNGFYNIVLTIFNSVVTICTTSLTFKTVRSALTIFDFCIYLRKNSDLCQFLHQLIGFNDIVLTPYNPHFTIRTASLTFNNCTLCQHCMYVFCIYLRTNSDLCHLQDKLISFYNIV